MTMEIIIILVLLFIVFHIQKSRTKENFKNETAIIELSNTIIDHQKSTKNRLKNAEIYRTRALDNDLSNAENQVKFIQQCQLYAYSPVNGEAYKILRVLEIWKDTFHKDWRIAFEVSMGSFIKTSMNQSEHITRSAFKSYNSKRVDFLLVNRFGQPCLVVEYHGSGHDLSGDAAERMTVKRLALEKANIPLVEFGEDITSQENKHIFQILTQAVSTH